MKIVNSEKMFNFSLWSHQADGNSWYSVAGMLKIKLLDPIKREILAEEFIGARFGGQRPSANLGWCLCTHLCADLRL